MLHASPDIVILWVPDLDLVLSRKESVIYTIQ